MSNLLIHFQLGKLKSSFETHCIVQLNKLKRIPSAPHELCLLMGRFMIYMESINPKALFELHILPSPLQVLKEL